MSTATSDLALELKDVAKTYGRRVHALQGVDLVVQKGEVFGLLGPNGAGKSTLIKILMTVIRPSRCEGHMLGRPVGDKSVLSRVGYLPEHHKFPEYLTATQALNFYGAFNGVDRADRKRRIPEILDLVGMSEWADAKIGGYSKGMRQRIGIAQALIHDPELVLLDEPTDGVDPEGRRDIREILARMRAEGKAIFLNSHILSELEQVCDRVAILVKGEVRSQGTIDSLTVGQERFSIEVVPNDDAEDAAASVRAALASHLVTSDDDKDAPTLKSGEKVTFQSNGRFLSIWTGDAAPVQPVIDDLRRAGFTIRAVRPQRPSLEDLFMAAVRDPETGERTGLGAVRGKGNKKS